MKMRALTAIKYGGAVRLPTDADGFEVKTKKDIDLLKDGGFAVPEKAEAQPAPKKPTAEDVQSALISTILPGLTSEEWGSDGVPNVDLLKGKLADHFDQSVALSAADRDAAVAGFREKLGGGAE